MLRGGVFISPASHRKGYVRFDICATAKTLNFGQRVIFRLHRTTLRARLLGSLLSTGAKRGPSPLLSRQKDLAHSLRPSLPLPSVLPDSSPQRIPPPGLADQPKPPKHAAEDDGPVAS